MAVTLKRKKNICICIDPRPLNCTLQREHHSLPALDDVLPELSKAKAITTVDLASGYWHIKLDDKSSYLTTFNAPQGRYRWLCLPFGSNVSSVIFAKKLNNCVHDLKGVITVADDILIYGTGDTNEDAYKDHNTKSTYRIQKNLLILRKLTSKDTEWN